MQPLVRPDKSPGPALLNLGKGLLQPLLSIVVGLLLCSAIIAAAGENVFEIYGILFSGGFGKGFYILATLTRAVPIIACGLGALFAWRAGYINLGGEGQMVAGGFMAVVAALYLPFRGLPGIIIAFIVGIGAGGLYAFLAAWLQERFNVFLLISTLMFNYVAHYITFYFVSYPMKDYSLDGITAKTFSIDPSLRLLRLNWARGTTFHIGFFIIILVTVLVVFLLKKTTFGYESKMTGLNRDFSAYGGIKSRKIMFLTMFGSGALAAMGGVIEVLGVKYLYLHEMLRSPSYAWTGLMAALIANHDPVGTVLCAIFLAGLQTGGAALERRTNIPLEITIIIQSVIILLVSVKILGRLLLAAKAKYSAKAKGAER